MTQRNATAARRWLDELGASIDAAAGLIGIGHGTLRRILNEPDYAPGRRVVRRCAQHGLLLDETPNTSERHAQQRAELEDAYPASEGWMWGDEFYELTGVPTKVRALSWRQWRWERVSGKAGARYRILSDNATYVQRTTPSCAGCSKALTPNRTYVLDGVKVCHACRRRIFSDSEFARSIGVPA